MLLLGALPKKLGAETLAVLEGCAEHVVLTNAALGEANPLKAGLTFTFAPEPKAALETALARCKAGGQVVIAGSFYLAGRLRPTLRGRSANCAGG